MNTTINTAIELETQSDVAIDLFRDIVDAELLLIGGGDILINNG